MHNSGKRSMCLWPRQDARRLRKSCPVKAAHNVSPCEIAADWTAETNTFVVHCFVCGRLAAMVEGKAGDNGMVSA